MEEVPCFYIQNAPMFWQVVKFIYEIFIIFAMNFQLVAKAKSLAEIDLVVSLVERTQMRTEKNFLFFVPSEFPTDSARLEHKTYFVKELSNGIKCRKFTG